MSRLKIVYLYHSTFNSGGGERILCDKTRALIERGVEIIIITVNQQSRANFYDFDPAITFYDLDINYGVCSNSNISKRDDEKRKKRLHFERLDALLKVIKPDITISMFYKEVSFLHKLTDGSKKIAEIHGPKYFGFEVLSRHFSGLAYYLRAAVNYIYLLNLIRGLRKLDKFVVLTEEDLKLWYELKNVVYIPNFSQLKYEDDVYPDYKAKRVIAMGRLDMQKGFDYLIDSWAIVNKQYPDWSLSIYGGGALRDSLQRQIDSLGLSSSITLEGVTSNVVDAYRKSSIYVMSSRSEGMPLVMLEAMVCKLPVVSYACQCGPRDLIDQNQTGFLIDKVGDVSGLAAGLMRLMESEELRRDMGEASYNKSKCYNESVVIDRWMSLFKEII